METVFWLLILFVVVFFANIARRKKMLKQYQALQQREQAEAAQPASASGETEARKPD